MSIKIFGIEPGNEVTITASDSDGGSDSVTQRRWGLPDATFEGGAVSGTPWTLSTTVSNPRSFPLKGITPRTRLHDQPVNEIDGRKLRITFDLDNTDVIRDKGWIGATVDAYRVTNGERAHVGSYTVTDANFGQWHPVAGDRTAFDATGYIHHFSNPWGTADVYWDLRPRWLGVAAVDATGAIGEIAYVSYTPTSMSSGAVQANGNTVALGANYTTGGALAAPGNVTATVHTSGPRTVQVTHDAVAGAIGYMHFLSWDDPTTHPTWKFMEVDGDGIAVHDFIIVRRQFTGLLQTDWLGTSSMGAPSDNPKLGFLSLYPGERYSLGAGFQREGVIDTSVVAYDGPDGDAGDWAIQYDFSAAAGTGSIDLFADAWNGEATQSFYTYVPPGEQWTFKARVWASRACDITLDVSVPGIPAQTFSVTTGWQTIELTGTATGAGTTSVGYARVQYDRDGSAIQLKLAGVDLRRVGGDLLFPQEFRDRLSPGIAIRDHTFIKTAPGAYQIRDIFGPDFQGWQNYSVNQFLKSCLDIGCIPWLQIEPYISPAEWAFVADFLFAPVASGTDGALRRQALGRDAPWVDAFDTIYIEFGNEAWQSQAPFFGIPFETDDLVDVGTDTSMSRGVFYGVMARGGAVAMESTAHWRAGKIKYVLGGHAINPTFTADAVRGFAKPCNITVAAYNGGWDRGDREIDETDESYDITLGSTASTFYAEWDAAISAVQTACAEVSLTYGTDVVMGCYEGGAGYQFGLTAAEQIVQEVVMKSVAASTDTLHAFLAQAARGFSISSYFSLKSGDLWATYARAEQGGATYASWVLLKQLHDLFGSGMQVRQLDMLYPDQTTVENGFGNPAVIDNAFCFQIESATGRRGFVVGSMTRERTQEVRLNLGYPSPVAMTGYILDADSEAHNRYPVGQRLTTSDTFEADPKSQDLSLTVRSVTVPTGYVSMDTAFGFDAGGIAPAHCGIFAENV
jgi:hypothetical protein